MVWECVRARLFVCPCGCVECMWLFLCVCDFERQGEQEREEKK